MKKRRINRIKRQIKNTRLVKERNKLIRIARKDNFFDYEIAEIFKISDAMLSRLKVNKTK